MISWTSLKFKTSALQVNVKGMKTWITHWEKVFAKEISDKYYFQKIQRLLKFHTWKKNHLPKNKQKRNPIEEKACGKKKNRNAESAYAMASL